MIHNPLDRKLLCEHVYPLHKMRRCHLGATQNMNKSPHNSIWSKCIKTRFCTRRTVHLHTVAAIAELNARLVWTHDTLMRLYGLTTGQDVT
ncbi:hypothetical protein PoB_004387500 [Plakobranchus ocellatus]|uniref:Transposase n=1 Tax=Plakobranchus ocellatus TaxID=259542 RepID=A0AAV4BE38_9GAST|nr:hypothetical protein PoB_004387500 [Plakobranchus ocellatus]